MIYYSLLIVVGLVCLFSTDIKNKKKKSQIIVLISCAFIVVIQGLRAECVGTDLRSYIPSIDLAKDLNFLQGEKLYNYELGYSLFLKLLANLDIKNQMFLTICSLITIIPFGYIWIKKSKNSGLSIYIYITFSIFLFSFSGLRQAIAIAITFFSYKYIEKRQLYKFILFIILAMLFHKSAVVFVLAYPLYNLNIKVNKLFFILPTLFCIFIIRAPLFRLIYSIYKGDGYVAVDTGAYTMLIIFLGIYILSYIFVDRTKRTHELIVYQNYLLITIIIQIFASQSNDVMRAGYYYSCFITLLIPEVIHLQSNRLTKYIGNYCVVVFLLYFYYVNLSKGYLDVTPYIFFWEY